MNNYYVYMLVDPRNRLPFYIGKGKRYKSSNERSEVHLAPGHKQNGQKCQRISDIRNSGLEPKVFYCWKQLEETEAYNLEVQLIDTYGRISKGGILTNICRDRRPPGMTGRKHSEETKRKYSETRKGRTHKTSTKQLMSSQRLGTKNHNSLTWHIVDPQGNQYVVDSGLQSWCKSMGFKFTSVYHSLRGWKTTRHGTGKGGPGKGNK